MCSQPSTWLPCHIFSCRATCIPSIRKHMQVAGYQFGWASMGQCAMDMDCGCLALAGQQSAAGGAARDVAAQWLSEVTLLDSTTNIVANLRINL